MRLHFRQAHDFLTISPKSQPRLEATDLVHTKPNWATLIYSLFSNKKSLQPTKSTISPFKQYYLIHITIRVIFSTRSSH